MRKSSSSLELNHVISGGAVDEHLLRRVNSERPVTFRACDNHVMTESFMSDTLRYHNINRERVMMTSASSDNKQVRHACGALLSRVVPPSSHIHVYMHDIAKKMFHMQFSILFSLGHVFLTMNSSLASLFCRRNQTVY